MNPVLLTYLLGINFLSFLLMQKDKHAARSRKWRVPENTLFFLAFIGGSLGILAGMHSFRHKTKHVKFTVGIPVLLILNVIIVYSILSYI